MQGYTMRQLMENANRIAALPVEERARMERQLQDEAGPGIHVHVESCGFLSVGLTSAYNHGQPEG